MLVGCPKYYKYCIESEHWFDQDFIRSHAVLAAHQSHNPKLQVINVATPMQDLLPTQCKELKSNNIDVVSILYGRIHYCVAVMNATSRIIYIHDGLDLSLHTWKDHALTLLKRCKLVDLATPQSFGWTTGSKTMVLQDPCGNWILRPALKSIPQDNDFDCGPLACLQIMRIFGRVQDNAKLKSMTTLELHTLVVSDCQKLLHECKEDLPFVKQKTTKGARAEAHLGRRKAQWR